MRHGQLTEALDDTARWVGRISAVAYEGKRAVGLGAVLQTEDTLTYLSLAEVAAILDSATMLTALIRGCTDNQFVLMLSAGDRVTATVVAPRQPLAVLYEQWGHTLTSLFHSI